MSSESSLKSSDLPSKSIDSQSQGDDVSDQERQPSVEDVVSEVAEEIAEDTSAAVSNQQTGKKRSSLMRNISKGMSFKVSFGGKSQVQESSHSNSADSNDESHMVDSKLNDDGVNSAENEAESSGENPEDNQNGLTSDIDVASDQHSSIPDSESRSVKPKKGLLGSLSKRVSFKFGLGSKSDKSKQSTQDADIASDSQSIDDSSRHREASEDGAVYDSTPTSEETPAMALSANETPNSQSINSYGEDKQVKPETTSADDDWFGVQTYYMDPGEAYISPEQLQESMKASAPPEPSTPSSPSRGILRSLSRRVSMKGSKE